MRKKSTFLLIIVFISLNVVGMGTFINTTAVADKPIVYEPIDIGPRLRESEFSLNMEYKKGLSDSESSTTGLQTSSVEGDIMTWIWYDDMTGIWLADYELRGVGTRCELWVMIDLSWASPADPRPIPVITGEQVDYMVEEFDNNIYPTLSGYFGEEDLHDGSNALFGEWGLGDYTDPDGKTVILVSNIGDESYYDYTYPSYIAGLYWGDVFELYVDRNVISIDAFAWDLRTGSQEPPAPESRPYLYESTFAHEFQHLLHDDIFPGDETYMNEACSLYSEPLCGYPIDYGQIEWFLATPDNSLIEWGDQGGINILADYGAAFLWAVYLMDHYGSNFLRRYVQGEPDLSLGSIPRISELIPGEPDFYDVYHDWRIANLLNADGLYGYISLDLSGVYPLNVHEIAHKKIPWTTSEMLGFTYTHPTQYAPKGYKLDEFKLGPFGTDYIALTGLEGEVSLLFDGHDLTSYDYGWKHTDHVWESGAGDLINILLAGETWVDPNDPELEITTYWDIEDYWDFGFVQISIDEGETWTSLNNEWMTYDRDPNCHNKIKDYLPGLTGWTYYYDINPITMTFDLSDYAGEDILVGFRYMTDWGTTYEGWKIFNDVLVSGNSVELANLPYDADFMVTMVAMTGSDYEVFDLSIEDATEFGSELINSADFDELIIIISPISEYGLTDYDFRTTK